MKDIKITSKCTKANRLSAQFFFNGFSLILDNKVMSPKEIKESDYRFKDADRLIVELLFNQAVKSFGTEYETTYKAGLAHHLNGIKAACSPKKNNKYLYEIVVQEFVPGYGWEDSCTEETTKEAREQVKCYQKNGVAARWINRRVPNPDYVAK